MNYEPFQNQANPDQLQLTCCYPPRLATQLDARGRRLQPDHVAGLPQQLHQPAHIHHLQPGVQEGLQEDPRHGTLSSARFKWQNSAPQKVQVQ